MGNCSDLCRPHTPQRVTGVVLILFFLFQHFAIRGTFLDAWTGSRRLLVPVQKQLAALGVNWSGRNPLLVRGRGRKGKGGKEKEQKPEMQLFSIA